MNLRILHLLAEAIVSVSASSSDSSALRSPTKRKWETRGRAQRRLCVCGHGWRERNGGGGGDSESEWWGERAELSSPLSSLQFSCHWGFCFSLLGLSHKERISPPPARFYLFDFTPCRPKRPLPRVQNGSGLFCSKAHSHREPWKGLFDDAGSVLIRVFIGNGNLRFSQFWVLLTLWERDWPAQPPHLYTRVEKW